MNKINVAIGDAVMLTNWVWVGLGGAIGAMARYGVGLLLPHILGKTFPFATLTVNILGSFLLAMLLVWQQQQSIHQSWWLFLGVGLLGAFTTFSTFSIEVVQLAQQGELLKAAIHAAANFICCLAAVLIALWLKPYYLNIWD